MRTRLATDVKSKPYRAFRHKNGYFYIRIHAGGKDVWRSLRTKKRREADALAWLLWSEHQSSPIHAEVLRPALTLDMLWLVYERSPAASRLAESTLATKKRRWESFVRHAESFGAKSMADVSPAAIVDHLASIRTAKGRSNALADLRSVHRESVKRGGRDPFASVSAIDAGRAAVQRDYRAFSESELKSIFAQLSQSRRMKRPSEWLTAALTAYHTGLRYKDVISLRIEDFARSHLTLIPAKTSRLGKSVDIAIHPALASRVASLNRSKGLLCPGLAADYKPGRDNTLPFARVLAKLGIEGDATSKVGFHSLRSTFTTLAVAAGVPPDRLGGVLGHVSTDQTRHYDKTAADLDLSKIPTVKIP